MNASLENQHSPMLISVLKSEIVTAVNAGSRHSVFLTESNRVYVCGDAN